MNFLLTGTYSSRNKGDAAMQLSTARALRRRWPEAKITISAPFAAEDAGFYRDFEVVASTRRRLIWGSLQVVRAWLYRRIGRRGAALVANPELAAFRQADLIVDLSGDTLTEDYGPHVTYSHFLPILLGLAMGKPVFICAQSIGPFRLMKGFARSVLRRTRTITARDEITLAYLHGLGLEAEHTADMAFLLDPAPEPRIDEILEQEGLEWPSEPVLGVSVSELVFAKHRRGRRDGPGLASRLAALLDRAVDELGARVLFVGHVTGPRPSKDDRLAAERVRGEMRHADRCLKLSGDYGPDELKGVIRRCHAFLGARMHANIAALSTGVPVVALAYSHKTPGIMAMFGQAERACPVESFDEGDVFAKLERVWNDRREISATIAAGHEEVRRRAGANLDKIRAILESVSDDDVRP